MSQGTGSLSQRVEDMDGFGVDLQILSLSCPQVYFLEPQASIDMARLTNDYLAEAVQQYPDRFRALASIPLTAGMDAASAEFERCVDQLEMVGVLLGANIDGIPIDDPRFDDFYAEANRRGTTFLIHPMIPAGIETMNQYALAPLVGFMMDTTLAIARLIYSNFFTRYPKINIIAGQLGATAPYLAGRFDIGYRAYPECQDIDTPPSEILKQVYLDTVSYHLPALRCAVDTVGADQIVLGSDYPQVIGDVQKAVSDVRQLGLNEEETDQMLGGTAARLFGIG